MVLLTTLVLLAASAAASPDTRSVDLPLQRLERKIVDARDSGQISSGQYEDLSAKLASVRTMRDEALTTGAITAAEKKMIQKAIREVEVDLAEAKFGAHKAAEAADAEEQGVPDLPALTGDPVPRPETSASAGSAL